MTFDKNITSDKKALTGSQI